MVREGNDMVVRMEQSSRSKVKISNQASIELEFNKFVTLKKVPFDPIITKKKPDVYTAADKIEAKDCM